MFREHDGDHDGALHTKELHSLLHAISPTLVASRADAAYFSVRRSSLPLRGGGGSCHPRWTRQSWGWIEH
jgi:hypothetical protein